MSSAVVVLSTLKVKIMSYKYKENKVMFNSLDADDEFSRQQLNVLSRPLYKMVPYKIVSDMK